MKPYISDLRAALREGIGANAASYDVTDAAEALGHPEVVLAIDLPSHRAYLITYGDLVPDKYSDRIQFLADACATLTRRWGTLVAPAAGTVARTLWGCPSKRGATAFELTLLDRPLRVESLS